MPACNRLTPWRLVATRKKGLDRDVAIGAFQRGVAVGTTSSSSIARRNDQSTMGNGPLVVIDELCGVAGFPRSALRKTTTCVGGLIEHEIIAPCTFDGASAGPMFGTIGAVQGKASSPFWGGRHLSQIRQRPAWPTPCRSTGTTSGRSWEAFACGSRPSPGPAMISPQASGTWPTVQDLIVAGEGADQDLASPHREPARGAAQSRRLSGSDGADDCHGIGRRAAGDAVQPTTAASCGLVPSGATGCGCPAPCCAGAAAPP